MTIAMLLLALFGTDPVPGYWQPGGDEGRVGSPYYYSIPARDGWHGAAYGHRRHHAACDCGRSRRLGHYGYDHAVRSGHVHDHRAWTVDPYTYHFGPGYYRYTEHGHYRFPYYSYRRPWYYPGPPVFNRDTNFAW
ncbi:MAG: hypothetical protein ACE5KM_17235 [Planctomycetaceae bacterium]